MKKMEKVDKLGPAGWPRTTKLVLAATCRSILDVDVQQRKEAKVLIKMRTKVLKQLGRRLYAT